MSMGFLMSVESISIRLRIGGIYRFVSFGSRTVLFSFLMILFIVMFGRYCFCGLSWMVVFIIFSGVESVAVFVFSVLLNIRVILGTFIISLSVFCSIFVVFVAEIFGSVDGIYNKSFLLICGKNFSLILLSG